MGGILLIILVLFLIGAFPREGSWGANYGYAPMGGIGLILMIVLILVLVGFIPHGF
jgi:hypothetical protein